MLCIGLTGGIGSGKSTAAHYFAELGVPVIDADQIARAFTAAGHPLLLRITAHLGNQFLTPLHELNRTALRDHLQHHPKQWPWLNQCLHPSIIHQLRQEVCNHSNAPYCICVIPLLIETGPYDFIDRIAVVDCDRKLQQSRAQTRDGQTKQGIDAMIQQQATPHERLNMADDIIHNTQNLSALRAEIVKLHETYLKMTSKDDM